MRESEFLQPEPEQKDEQENKPKETPELAKKDEKTDLGKDGKEIKKETLEQRVGELFLEEIKKVKGKGTVRYLIIYDIIKEICDIWGIENKIDLISNEVWDDMRTTIYRKSDELEEAYWPKESA